MRKQYKVEGAQVDFITYTDSPKIGYIRIEKRGEYLHSFDGRKKNKKFLLQLRKTVNQWLRELK